MDKTIDRWTDPDGNGYAFKDTVARAQNRATIDKMNAETADRKSELDIERKRIDNLIKELPATAGEYQQSKLVLHSYGNTAVKCTTTSGNYTNVPAFTTDQGGPLSSLYTKKSNYQIAVNKSGLYLFELRIHVNSLIANKRVELAPFVNDTRIAALASSYNTAGSFTLTQVAALPLWLSANDTVDFRIAPIDAAKVSLQLGDVLVYAIDWEDKFKIPDYTGYTAETKDIRTGADGIVYGTAGEAVRKQIGNLTEDIAEISEVDETDNKYNPFSDECIDESYLQIFDIIEDTRLKISNKIHVKKGDIVRFIKNSFTNKNAGAIYNTNGLPQVSIYSNGYTEETWNDYVICASVSPIDGYYLVNMEKRGDATVNMIFVNKSFPADGKFVPYHRERLIRKSCIEKYIEPFGLTANVLNGNYEEVYSNIPLSFNKVDGYYNKNGKFFANEGYEEAVVDVKKGEKYYLTSYNYFQIARAFFRDSSGTFVGSVYTANNNKLEENTEVAIPENAVTMHLQRLTNKRVELLGKTGYELIARVNEVSPLYGKKLVTAGDSYTHASFSGNYAEYDGKNYGYYVAKRHGMTFINSGMSGSIMALDKDYVANPTSVPITSRNPFSYQRYLDVPEDTDYLTIWFGINDNAHTNLGTIDDATNETFYGAWNKVLRYYLTNRPFMKVGLIVTVGASERYRQAIRDVAKKWGYPYLDWVNDDSIPAFFDRTGMSDEARTLRRQAYGYNDFSAHPNPQFHEYVSTIYEKFLLSL